MKLKTNIHLSIPHKGPKPVVCRGDTVNYIVANVAKDDTQKFPEVGFWHNVTINMLHKPPPYEHLCGVLLSLRRVVPPTFIELCYANQLSINMPAHDRDRAFLHWVINPDELKKTKRSGDRDAQLKLVNGRVEVCTYGPNSNISGYAPISSETEALLQGYDSLPILYSEVMSAMRAASEANNEEFLAAVRTAAENIGDMINFVYAVNSGRC